MPAFAMAAGLAGLWARRFLVERIRYISTPSDHLMLALLLGIAITGLAMKFVMHTDVVAVKTFFLGLMRVRDQSAARRPWPLPASWGMVALLMIVFPVSKLLHAPGVFFSPTRNQVDNPRETRHLAPWAASSRNEEGIDEAISHRGHRAHFENRCPASGRSAVPCVLCARLWQKRS
jgi:nitrate reductase gamma subunit